MLNPERQRAAAYGVAVLTTTAATLLRVALTPLLGDHLPFITYFLAISFTAWVCGLGPSLASVAMGAIAARIFFMGSEIPRVDTTTSNTISLISFLLVGTVISLLSGSIQRARVRAEAAAEALSEGREQMAGILASAMDAIITVNAEQRITLFNSAAEQIFRCSAADALGQPIDRFIPGRFREGHRSYVADFGADNITRRSMGRLGAISALRANGEEFPIEASISHVTIHGQKLFTVILRDITQRKRAEEEREQLLGREREARRSAESAGRLKDDFLATVSHELRTPLNAILGWTRMLHTGRLDQPTATRAMESIERNAKAQAQIIEDILDVSRIITGQLRLDLRLVDLRSVTETALDTIRLAADAKGIETRLSWSQDVGPVLGDPNRLQQVLWNLLSNSVKFTPAGGRVEISLDRVDTLARITVQDTGKGINPEFLQFVFDRFRQGDSSTTRKHGGLGLGLAIVRHIVELHGGTVQATSAGEGSGSTFVVELPIAVHGEAGSRSSITASTSARVEPKPHLTCPRELVGMRILVVDDEPDTLRLIEAVLKNCGAQVTKCSSASEALSMLEVSLPDVLICDIALPGEDGFSLIGKLRARDAGSGGNIPAAALTAYSRVEDRMKVLSAGFQMFVPKPVEPDELVQVVASLTIQSPKRAEDEENLVD
jgi:PAS domain S-box-containing protein